ncbi:MAG: DUF503 domain-containing protein [Acidimicrobiales bacterium]
MHVGVVRFELHVPQSRSLKEKRAVVKPIVEGIRHRFSLSVAEVAHQDTWQRAAIGVAVVSPSHAQAVEVLESVERWVWSRPGIEVASTERQWSGWDDAG